MTLAISLTGHSVSSCAYAVVFLSLDDPRFTFRSEIEWIRVDLTGVDFGWFRMIIVERAYMRDGIGTASLYYNIRKNDHAPNIIAVFVFRVYEYVYFGSVDIAM